MEKRHRTFIAINLTSDIRKFLIGFEKKHGDLPAKWTPAENLHITLVFLGDLTDEEVGKVCIITKNIARRHESFNINLQKIGYGPQDKIPPRYIWVGGQMSQELSSLKKELEESFEESIVYKKDTKHFAPHITLARIQAWQWRQIEPEERPEVNEDIDITFTVESIEVMESELKRGGPEYIVLESCALKEE